MPFCDQGIHTTTTALGDIHKVRTQPNGGPTKYNFILRTMGRGKQAQKLHTILDAWPLISLPTSELDLNVGVHFSVE